MRLRSAILLDFDNVWHSLQKESERAAVRFANSPSVWVDAIANGELLAFTEPDAVARAILFMRCYANPNLMQRAKCRPSFTRAGFSVIDCPPLTNQGKNSADIHMVLDAIELLEHSTRFDEFIVLSADADFTPLLTKLRTHDRRTAVFANQETSAAYRAVASGMLQLNDMLDFLSESGSGRGASGSSVDPDLADRMIAAVIAQVREAGAPVPLSRAAQAASDANGGDPQNWAGYGQFRRLLADRLDSGLRVAGEPLNVVYDPAFPLNATPSVQPQTIGTDQIIDEPLAARLMQVIHAAIADAPVPIPGARAAQLASDAVGGNHRSWAGYGQFGKLLKNRLDPRYLYENDHLQDVARHAPPEATGALVGNPTLSPRIGDLPAELRDFALRLRGLTDCPTLTGPQFRALFEVFANRVQDEPFDLSSMSRNVRDELLSRGLAIGRAAVSFVMKGIQLSGHDFGGLSTPTALAAAYRDCLTALCEQAGAELSAEESRLLGEWLGC